LHIQCAFEGVSVHLGGQHYRDCTFTNCDMIFDGKPADLQGCTLDGCRWSFVGDAGSTLEFAGMMCRESPEMAEMFGRSLSIIREQSVTH